MIKDNRVTGSAKFKSLLGFDDVISLFLQLQELLLKQNERLNEC